MELASGLQYLLGAPLLVCLIGDGEQIEASFHITLCICPKAVVFIGAMVSLVLNTGRKHDEDSLVEKLLCWCMIANSMCRLMTDPARVAGRHV